MTLAYVGSMVGVTTEIDESSINKQEFVRMKICCRDVAKVPESVEDLIVPNLYGFFFEREVEIPSVPPKSSINVAASTEEEQQAKRFKPTGMHQTKTVSSGYWIRAKG